MVFLCSAVSDEIYKKLTMEKSNLLKSRILLHHQMHVIQIKANRLHCNAGHPSKQHRQYLSQLAGNARFQDPAAVFASPKNVVSKIVNTVSGFYIFHDGVMPTGSFIHG